MQSKAEAELDLTTINSLPTSQQSDDQNELVSQIRSLIKEGKPLNHPFIFHFQQKLDDGIKQWIYTNITALHFAVLIGDTDLVKTLLAAGADKEARFSAASILALTGGDKESSTKLGKCTALHLAMYLGQSEVVDLLLKAGVNIHASFDYYDPTQIERWETFTYLYKNFTALHFAIHLRNTALVNGLLNAGADASQTFDYEGYGFDDLEWFAQVTPLHHATRYNLQEEIVLLLNAGADINALYYNKYWRCGDGDDEGYYKGYQDIFNAAGFNMASEVDLKTLSAISAIEKANHPLEALRTLTQDLHSSSAELKNLFLKRGFGLCNSFSNSFVTDYIGKGASTENCLVIGMTIDGNPVTRATPGFENAITTLSELKIFLNTNKDSFFDTKTHLKLVKTLVDSYVLTNEFEKAKLCVEIKSLLRPYQKLLQGLSIFSDRKANPSADATQNELEHSPEKLFTFENN